MNKLLLTLIVLFTATQTLASEEDLLDQFNIGDEVYNVVLDEAEEVNITTGLEASAGGMSKDLIAQIIIYNTKKTEITPGEKFNLFMFSRSICREYGENSKSLINPKGSGFKLERILAFNTDDFLSEDKKTFHFTCSVTARLKKS